MMLILNVSIVLSLGKLATINRFTNFCVALFHVLVKRFQMLFGDVRFGPNQSRVMAHIRLEDFLRLKCKCEFFL